MLSTEFCVIKGLSLSVLFDEQDIKRYLKIIEICLREKKTIGRLT